jgi:hypothetical protein
LNHACCHWKARSLAMAFCSSQRRSAWTSGSGCRGSDPTVPSCASQRPARSESATLMFYADMVGTLAFMMDGTKLEQSGCSAFNLKFRQMSEHCDFNLYLQYAQEMLRQQEARFRQCQSIRQDWYTEQLMTDHKSFEKRQSSYATINRWRTQCRNVDR